MPSTSHIRNFSVVFSILCLAALVLVLLGEFSAWKWAERVVGIGQTLGRMVFTATAIAYILVEGQSMLSELFKRARFEEGRQEGRALEREEWQSWRKRLEEWEGHRKAAEEVGATFNEPRPVPPGA